MPNKQLIITSIAGDDNEVLQLFAEKAAENDINFLVIGDLKSPQNFDLPNCDFYSADRQKELSFQLIENLPFNHYARKNIGYLVAMSDGAEIIIETDDDNLPYSQFWEERNREVQAHSLTETGWVNVYKYFSDTGVWPRGFSLEHILNEVPELKKTQSVLSPIQQGLADDNPDVDAMFRMTQPLPLKFKKGDSVALGTNSFCPFNSQNTTWFKEAFPLLYLPSYCSFRMTDIWRSFVAQRIAWEYGWSILFHNSTVWQERNDHNLMKDFSDEISGYLNNNLIYEELKGLKLKQGLDDIGENLISCYRKLIDLDLVGSDEMALVEAWISDVNKN